MSVGALQLLRLSQRLRSLGVPVLPGIVEQVNAALHHVHLAPDCEFAAGAELGYGGIGVVVEQGARIGRGSLLCQDVTVGRGAQVGDEVLVGAGAKIAAGVRIANGARIGANALVDRDVGPGVVVTGVPWGR